MIFPRLLSLNENEFQNFLRLDLKKFHIRFVKSVKSLSSSRPKALSQGIFCNLIVHQCSGIYHWWWWDSGTLAKWASLGIKFQFKLNCWQERYVTSEWCNNIWTGLSLLMRTFTKFNQPNGSCIFFCPVILEKPIRIPRSLSVKAASILKGFLNKVRHVNLWAEKWGNSSKACCINGSQPLF